MDPIQLILLALITVVAAMVQASAGFGYGLIATPAMIWIGMSLPDAIAVAIMITLVQMSANGYQLRGHMQWKVAWFVIVLRLLMLPIGTVMLVALVGMGQTRVKQAIGLLILVALLTRWLLRIQPREHLPLVWHWVTGITSGIMAGLAGMGGPPVVLWVQAHRWSNVEQRATLFAVLASSAPASLIILWLTFGSSVLWAMLVALAYVPVALLGAAVGMRLGERLSVEQLRLMASVMLVILAIGSVVGPLL